MASKELFVKRYLFRINRKLLCGKNTKKKLLSGLEQEIYGFADKQNDVDYGSITNISNA